MLEGVSLSVVIAVLGMIFSAGLTWGLMTAKTSKIEVVVQDLKTIVGKLEKLNTDTEVMKVVHSHHEMRIVALESTVSRLQAQP